jgi:MYXO-CTERM domain-containing protein
MTLDTPIAYGEYYAPPAFPQFVDGDELTLAGLFKWRKEQIDPIADAKTTPGYFFPGCGFSAELVLRGGGCSSGLGWYNVVPGNTTPPAASEIYALVPGDTSYLESPRTIFTPLGWDNRDPRDLSKLDWVLKAFDSGDLTKDPHYKGGEIGFALIGDPLSNCTQTKFSVYEHNVRNTSGVPWVTSITYRSTVDPTAIYRAFEDLPMSTADWRKTGSPGSTLTNDGDFNDFVFFISGLGATSKCPDPACRLVVCDQGMVCSAGVCVSGSGGSGAGGASAGGASAGGDTSAGAENVAGATESGGANTGGTANTSGAAGDSAPNSAAGGMANDGDPTSGGTSTSTPSGGTTNANGHASNGGCSCRVGAPVGPRYEFLAFTLLAGFAARRKRRRPLQP